jgi:two-component system CheB/CheR fusion protein
MSIDIQPFLRDSGERLLDRYRLLAQHARDIVLFIRPDGRIVEANDAAVAAYGYDHGTLLTLTIFELRAPSTAPQIGDQMTLADGLGLTFETLHRRSDGTLFPVEVSSRGADVGGERLLLSLIRDITDRKLAEAALREADRRKDEFLATLAHELRNPLAPIRNAVQILRMKETADPDLRWARDVIDRQARQLTRLVDDLLDVSRITQGKIELRRERIEIAALLERAVETSRPAIEAARHRLTVTYPEEPLELVADLTRMEQVLANLLNNAAKYTRPGGRIHLSAGREEDEAVIRVRDDGIGIPSEMLSSIFEMFAQVDTSLERTQGGLGIGLTISRRLVEMHGGTIVAASPGAGEGSELTVRLPLASRAEAAPDPRAEEAAPGAALRVLVVDDNEDSAESLAMLLQLKGHEVRTAHDGPRALVAAEEYRPDLVFLDIGMPGMNGFEVAARLRQRLETRNVLLVAMTGWGQEEDRRRSKEAGFDQHLVKPLDPKALDELLARAVPEQRPLTSVDSKTHD